MKQWIILLYLFFVMSGYCSEKPKLVLQITVDQLRADLPKRFMKNMGTGGFRYLYKEGIVFHNAHHDHANTETIVGHATLATGAYPAVHGLIANAWFDRVKGRLVYNIEDANYKLLSSNADVDQKTEIDPTQKAAKAEGRSPANILCSTFSDELSISTNGKSKIFAVSVKDRGAVSMAGHAGKAFWFSKKAGEFITSTYYYDKYPAWVTAWNKKSYPEQYSDTAWILLNDKSKYIYGEQDDQSWEMDFPLFGRVFPHNYGKKDGKLFNTLLTLSPAGDELTAKFAQELLDKENLGQGTHTDYLSVSFSSTDYVGHLYGMSSLEAEDNLYRLDQTIAKLLKHVDDTVGLENTLIVFSADHGGAEVPGSLKQHGIDAQYIVFDEIEKQKGFKALKEKYGVGEKLIEKFSNPYIYLNHEVIFENKLDTAQVQRAVAEELSKMDGVYSAISSTDLRLGRFPETEINSKVLKNYNYSRSGDVYVVFNPHCFINDLDGLHVASHHGSPWAYDTHVPIIFAGWDFNNKNIYKKVFTVQIAPTLSSLLNIKLPSGTTSKNLIQVFEGKSSSQALR